MGLFINKIGMEHVESGMNCQDYGFVGEDSSYICDGCSAGKHSEVGAKLFCHLKQTTSYDIEKIFHMLCGIVGEKGSWKQDFLSFTILQMTETAEDFVVNYCGDGYIILQDIEGNIIFEELTDGEYPKYYIYNYIDQEKLRHYKEGVDFSQKSFSKKTYTKVGIASDGLRFILRADDGLKQEFIDYLQSGKEMRTKLFINRNHKIFRDDITIIF